MANPRSIALVGPYLSGKTSLLESILFSTGATPRHGSVTDGSSVGDSAPEARAHNMTTEINIATTNYLGDKFTFVDCPGSVELAQETLNAIVGVDAAIVVCEPDADKLLSLAPVMKVLEDTGIPRMIFVNKIDKAAMTMHELAAAMQPVSHHPLVLRHIPLRDGEEVTGYVDLASERAYVYKSGDHSEMVELPEAETDREQLSRYEMLEALADFDDDLMEKVLEDVEPEKHEIYQNLTKDFQDGLIVPIFLGAAELMRGVERLLKALRHEIPDPAVAAERAGATGGNIAQILKTYHTQHGGKLSVARVWSGTISDGMTLNGQRLSGLSNMVGHDLKKLSSAAAGEIVALGRLDDCATGDTLSDSNVEALARAEQLPPVYSLAITAARRDDEVKMSTALSKLTDEDPGLIVDHDADLGELLLRGQGDIHLKLNVERMKSKYALEVTSARPSIPYREAISKSIQQHGRHKKQSGGHGQFGDVHLEIKPLPRGSGFEFVDKIVGGAVPKTYIPAVEAGVVGYLKRGPLGFQVVDVQVTLYDGQFHAVDSSEIAFKTAGQIAMREGMPNCGPVLLEPILQVDVAVPSEFTPKVNGMVSSRRGQILGFEMREGWQGWDVTSAQIPQSEMHDFIIELRSVTLGVGSFTSKFDHLQQLSGRGADEVINARSSDKAA